jgi:hypothetical protein
MSTATRAARNGQPTTTSSTPHERPDGMVRLHEEECYHLSLMVTNALGAAERLTRKVNRAASERYCDPNGDKDTPPLDTGELLAQLNEARACVRAADDYLLHVINAVGALNDSDPWGEEPF